MKESNNFIITTLPHSQICAFPPRAQSLELTNTANAGDPNADDPKAGGHKFDMASIDC